MTENSLPQAPLKQCTKCKQWFPATVEYFYRLTHCRYGVTSRCKPCTNAKNKEWSNRNPDKSRQIKRSWVERNHEDVLAYHAEYRADNPDKVQARYLVKVAIRHGDLSRIETMACIDCGAEAVDYHHPDYSKPLDVIPLCGICHAKRHS